MAMYNLLGRRVAHHHFRACVRRRRPPPPARGLPYFLLPPSPRPLRYLSPLFLILLCTCAPAILSAQIGLHPPRIDFQQLRSDHARIIFPAGYADRARRVAAMLDEMDDHHTRSIGERIYEIDLVLQTATTEINGYVGLGPFRSEFYTTPPQNLNLLSNNDWVDLLTIHEYRHVQQFSNARRGVTKLFSIIQGQIGWSVLRSIALPDWFIEGDAVLYETALSAGGRGRTPAFSATLRSLLRNNVIYSYQKARNGSFADLVPDHYRYGYNAVTYARERFGNDVWRDVVHDAAAYKGLFYPFSRNLKKQTGLGTRDLYRAAMADLAAAQDSFLAARPAFVAGQPFGPQRRGIVNYRFPQDDGAGRVLALRSSFDRTPELVVVNAKTDGRDEVLTDVGIQRESYFHVRGNLAVWMENRQHPRYTNERYSELVRYDLDRNQKTVLTRRGKYFSPALSFDRREIAAVFHDPTLGAPEIVILATNTGEVVERHRVGSPSVSFPRFSPDGATIYFYDVGLGGVAFRALDRASGRATTVREQTAEPLDIFHVTEAGTIVFGSGRDGIDNVYELDPETGAERQLTNVPVGTRFPHLAAGGKLLYAEATPVGMRLRQTSALEREADGLLAGLPGGRLPTAPNPFERSVAYAAEAYNLTQNVPEGDYEVTDFNDKVGGVRLHSWSFNGSYVQPTVELSAGNALNTTRMSAGVGYNINEQRPVFSAGLTYGGWLPVLDLGVSYRERNFGVLDPAADTVIFRTTTFDQLRVGGTASLPLNWVAGDYRYTVQPAIGYGYNLLSNNTSEDLPDNFGDLSTQLGVSFLHRQARRQVQPRWGGSLFGLYTVGLGEEIGNRFLLQGSLFLPGLWRTHGIRLDAQLQTEDAGNAFQFPDRFRYARGYGAAVNDRVSGFAVNYQLPVLYPDFGILGITYFRRVRLNVFYDRSFQRVDQYDFDRSFGSVGGQLFFDNAWLNTQDLTVGVQAAYQLDPLGDERRLRFDILASGGF